MILWLGSTSENEVNGFLSEKTDSEFNDILKFLKLYSNCDISNDRVNSFYRRHKRTRYFIIGLTTGGKCTGDKILLFRNSIFAG